MVAWLSQMEIGLKYQRLIWVFMLLQRRELNWRQRMQSSVECGLEFDSNQIKYSIFKLDNNGIGECGVRQLAKCHWNNLGQINLGNMNIIKSIIISETLAASG